MTACLHYGSMGKKERAVNESLFRSDMAKVMVATSSFGMGVDTVNVQCVVNYGLLIHATLMIEGQFRLPRSIVDFVQQAGRGGRSSMPCVSALFWLPNDDSRFQWLVVSILFINKILVNTKGLQH
jgi:superfamily II DNA helicase RecQ